jgi:hypothetical protein
LPVKRSITQTNIPNKKKKTKTDQTPIAKNFQHSNHSQKPEKQMCSEYHWISSSQRPKPPTTHTHPIAQLSTEAHPQSRDTQQLNQTAHGIEFVHHKSQPSEYTNTRPGTDATEQKVSTSPIEFAPSA